MILKRNVGIIKGEKVKCTTANERFYESGGVCPLEHLC